MPVALAPEERLSFLDSCLVEGNSDQEKRVRRNKRRALLISIVLQILIVAALVLFPLLSHGERINISDRFVVLPPVARLGHHSHKDADQRHTANRPPVCRFCAPTHISPTVVTQDTTPPQQIPDDNFDDSELSRYGSPGGSRDGIANSTREEGPAPPVDKRKANEPPPRIRVGTIEPAMLIHRVEPVYPPLGRQLRHEGRVELHALISTDGTIQSLEVISGDPLFIRSALDAVREWRYRPTILNGQPVEVDTHITVVYTLSH